LLLVLEDKQSLYTTQGRGNSSNRTYTQQLKVQAQLVLTSERL
jgi:hypothetical protein